MKKTVIILIPLLLILTLLWTLWANKAIDIREFTIEDEKIPSSFSGCKIAHVSDLHNETFGNENEKLLSMLSEAAPDVIALTGDIIDSGRTDVSVAVEFMTKALEIAPVYYVRGNHEPATDGEGTLLGYLEESGVKILKNESVTLTKDNESIILYGIDDLAFSTEDLPDGNAIVNSSLESLKKGDSFSILLAHRPEYFSLYTEHGFNLVLSGHAHGGQFRLPFIGGFIAPGQGFFPEYDSGLYEDGNTSMIVSRGLGNSVIPLRFNNRPDLIFITLEA